MKRPVFLSAVFVALFGLELLHSHDGHAGGLYQSHQHTDCASCLRDQIPVLPAAAGVRLSPVAASCAIALAAAPAAVSPYLYSHSRAPPASIA